MSKIEWTDETANCSSAPQNYECTRDPIFLLQRGSRQWTQIPDGLGSDGESLWVEDASLVDDWIKRFIVDGSVDTTEEFWQMAECTQNDHDWPMVYVEWLVESVFLTRKEAEEYGKAREYRWDKWRVYCVPCDGELAKILDAQNDDQTKNYQPNNLGLGLLDSP